MDFLKAQFTRISEQLAGLSATQKMLVVSLLTIMIMTLLWWSHWAAEPEMAPLLEGQTLSADESAQVIAALNSQGIPHQLTNGAVYVPADRKLEVMATLGYSNALPQNVSDGFDSIVKGMSWLDSPEKNQVMFNRAREMALKAMLKTWPGVANAEVIIDETQETKIDEPDVEPVATVTITTNHNSQRNPRDLAESAADMICRAKSGLKRSNISVEIDGESIPIRDRTADDGASLVDDGVALQQKAEKAIEDKIRGVLNDIHGLMVAVTVTVDTSSNVKTIHKIDPKQTVSVASHTEQMTSETTGGSSSSGEPGAVPNTSMALPAASTSGPNNSTTSDEKDDFDTDHGKQDEIIKQGPGTVTVVGATVRIPRSHFIQTWKAENDGKEPDDPAALKSYISTQLDEIKTQVKECAAFPSDDAITVAVVTDIPKPDLPMATDTAASPVSNVFNQHGKELGVGALAVVSLFMVSMMVRKGGSAGGGAVTEPLAGDDGKTVDGNEAIVGDAVEDQASLDGMELDEESVKAQRMVDQVQQMVQSNPDAAANLVKRWLNR
jgi:flagellar biosynthesis/type III secretory pathway M-ring protein FliF/YscJ